MYFQHPLGREFSYNVSDEVAVSAHDPNPPDRERDELERDELDPDWPQLERRKKPIEGPVEGKEVEDFFQRLPGNFRWPKPNAEAVAAAVEAIHRMSASPAAEDRAAAGDAGQPGTRALRMRRCAAGGRSLLCLVRDRG